MKTTFMMGLQPPFHLGKRSFFMGQLLSQAEKDHYLNAVTRGLSEADQIDAWLSANPKAPLGVPPGGDPALTVSPYYTKYFNFIPIRGAMQALKDRLLNADPQAWSSITPDEHTTFGWVSVLDGIYAAFLADPVNLTAGRWQGSIRLPDLPSAATVPAPSSDAILGIPKTVAILGGGAVAVGLVIFFIIKS